MYIIKLKACNKRTLVEEYNQCKNGLSLLSDYFIKKQKTNNSWNVDIINAQQLL